MLPLYQAIFAILTGDTELDGLLQANEADPRVYQTSVQFHSEAATAGKYWVTFNKVRDVADETEQTQAIRLVGVEVHTWGRDANSDHVDTIDGRISALLDGADLANADMLAWYFLQEGESSRVYEVDQKAWHASAVYRGKVAEVARLPS